MEKTELFMMNHPSGYVSIYMRHDWIELEKKEFLSKYIKELSTSKLDEKKECIKSIILPLWNGITTSEKYTVLGLVGEGKHYADTFKIMLDFQEAVNCEFMEIEIRRIFYVCTGLAFGRNYYAPLGVKYSER